MNRLDRESREDPAHGSSSTMIRPESKPESKVYAPIVEESKSKSEASIPIGEKSILLRGIRERSGTYPERTELIEAWFLVKRTGKGIGIKEIFQNVTTDNLPHPPGELNLRNPRCVQIGSFLYVLGGGPQLSRTVGGESHSVRRLDTKNPINGWEECKPLPFPIGFGHTQICAAGNLIYLFPGYCNGKEYSLGIIYDVTEQQGRVIVPPAGLDDSNRSCWFRPYCCVVAYDFGNENRGFLTRFGNDNHLDKYDPDQNRWGILEKIDLFNNLVGTHYAILNGVLYLSTYMYQPCQILNAYDVRTGESLLGNGIVLPEVTYTPSWSLLDDSLYLVVVADFKLCYLWFEHNCAVTVATVVVSSDRLSATVSEETLDIGVGMIQNVIPFDSYTDDDEESFNYPDKTDVEEEEFLLNCNYGMLEENILFKRLFKDYKRLREENKKLNATIYSMNRRYSW